MIDNRYLHRGNASVQPIPIDPFVDFGTLPASDHISEEQAYIRGGEGQNLNWEAYYHWAINEPELSIMKSRLYDHVEHVLYMD
jgi:hypothetical protein